MIISNLIKMNPMKSLTQKSIILAAALTLGMQVNAQQYKTAARPPVKFNRFAVGIRASHLYDVKFKPNQMLTNGFVAEDMKGLNGNKTKFDLAFGADVTYFFSPLFSMDLGYDKGKMTGAGTVEYYESDVSFFSLGANVSLKRAIRKKPYRFVPYFRASLAYATFDVDRKFKEDNSTFNHIEDECMQLGVGLGLRYHITENIHLNLVSEFVTSYTDKWDGFDYSNGNDHLVKTSLGLRYTFGKNNHADRALAWQDNRVDDLLATTPANNEQLSQATLQALSDSLRVMRESIAAMNTEMKQLVTDNADSDKDGVPDRNDQCPDQVGPVYNNGCPDTTGVKNVAKEEKPVTEPKAVVEPEMTRIAAAGTTDIATVKKMVLIEMSNVRFATGKAALDEEAIEVLNRNAAIMKENPDFRLIIYGYTDMEGSDRVNLRLSRQRANAVAAFLEKRGVDKSRLEVKPMGKQNPVDPRSTDRANANNRRVEFEVEIVK